MLMALLIVSSLVILLLVYIWWERRPFAHIPGVTQLGAMSLFSIPFIHKYIPHQEGGALDQLYENGFVKDGVLRITAFNASRIYISDADLIKDITLTRAKQFPKPPIYKMLDIWGSNIVSANGDVWKKHRMVADPAFAENHMNYLVQESAKSVLLCIKRMEMKRSNSKLVMDPVADMQDVTLDIIGKVAFGYDLEIFNPRKAKAPHELTFEEALKTTTTLGILVGGLLPSWSKRFFPQTTLALKETEAYMMELINHRLNHLHDVNKHDLLSLLVSSNAEQIKETSLTNQELVSDVFVFLIAGHETSATTLTWMLYELALNKRVQDKMYNEADKVLTGLDVSDMDAGTYDKLVYTKYAVTETLRKRPPVKMIPKMTKSDTMIGKYFVPKNTQINLNVFNIQLNEKYWPDAYTFKPERFDPESSEYHKVKSCAFLPFSLGARKCIGSKFSEVETCILIAYIVLHYEICIPKDDAYMNTKEVLKGRISTESRITSRPCNLKIEFKKRAK
ncbi:cytochrome P450 [Acrasis kona]|uniref:Cyp4x1 n=1 Tax=Acrasis kona TaxID=1008807 RepID=A0AAW2ZD70_9EUKA